MGKTITEQSFFEYYAEKFDFSSTRIEKTLFYGLAHVLRNLHLKAGLVLKNTDRIL